VTQQGQLLAGILKNGARALAGYAVAEAATGDAEARDNRPQPSFDGWKDLLATRVEDLSVAVSTALPGLFVQQVLWTQAALKARGVSSGFLRARLEALKHVLMEQLSGDLAPLATAPIDRALRELDGEPAELTPRLSAGTAEEQLAARYLVAILEGNRREAVRLILDAAGAGQSVTELYLQVLQPAQEELGRMWVLGEINVAEEHFATTTTRLVMAQLHAKAHCGPANGKTIVAATVAGNQHDLGIQMVADLFESGGWRAIQLGANVPNEDLAQAVEFYEADLVALAFSMPGQLPTLKDAIAAVRGSHLGTRIKIIAGGCRLPDIAEIISSYGADGFAADALEAVALGNALVGLQAV
jgi:MerR family transcriptional regulator, light-induced transcriptional regulator